MDFYKNNNEFNKTLSSIATKYQGVITIYLSSNMLDGTHTNINRERTGGTIYSSSSSADEILRGMVFELCNASNEALWVVNDLRKYNTSIAFAEAMEKAEMLTVERVDVIFYGKHICPTSFAEDLEFTKKHNNDSFRRGGLTHFDSYRVAWLNYHIDQLKNNPLLKFFSLGITNMNSLKALEDELKVINLSRKELTTDALLEEIQSDSARAEQHNTTINLKAATEETALESNLVISKLQKAYEKSLAIQKETELVEEKNRELEAEIARLKVEGPDEAEASHNNSRHQCCSLM